MNKDNEQSRQKGRMQCHWWAQNNKSPQNFKAFQGLMALTGA